MQKLNTLAVLLVILTLGSWFVQITSNLVLALAPEELSVDKLVFYRSLDIVAKAAIPLTLNLLIGVWLFLSARKTAMMPWVWLLLGMRFGLVAAILFYCVDIQKRLESSGADLAVKA